MKSHRFWLLLGAGLVAGATATAEPQPATPAAAGANTQPVRLVRARPAPLSAMALLGREIFYDASLSSSGKLSCASCHSPEHHYGPPNDGPVMLGGPTLSRQGARAVPSLAYHERHPGFSIGPEANDSDNVVPLAQSAAVGQQSARARKDAKATADAAANVVPQGGMFWDGRANTLQDQAVFPLTDPDEMDGGSIAQVADKLQHAPYAERFTGLFGAGIFQNLNLFIAEAMFAVGRYQIEEPSFHPYTSKYDYWLEGKARLSDSELRGLQLFNDPDKANCGGCHLSQPTRDGLPPVFTDYQFEALGAPRNAALRDNGDPGYFDLGACGPTRKDIAEQTQYCGMFQTPTLRNTATRKVFFHNGVFTSLQQMMDFYNFRDIDPGRVYPHGADGTVAKYDDLPEKYFGNVDVADPPFDRHQGDAPAMTAQEEADIIAFLNTLTDGWQPDP